MARDGPSELRDISVVQEGEPGATQDRGAKSRSLPRSKGTWSQVGNWGWGGRGTSH